MGGQIPYHTPICVACPMNTVMVDVYASSVTTDPAAIAAQT